MTHASCNAGRKTLQVNVNANVDLNKLIDQIASASNQPDSDSFVQDVVNKAANTAQGYNVLVRGALVIPLDVVMTGILILATNQSQAMLAMVFIKALGFGLIAACKQLQLSTVSCKF